MKTGLINKIITPFGVIIDFHYGCKNTLLKCALTPFSYISAFIIAILLDL